MNAPQTLLLALFLALAWAPPADRLHGAPTQPPAPERVPPAPRAPETRPVPIFSEPGPDVAIIDDLVNHYGPVTFDHRLHERMSEITGDCANCHHETEANEPITGCAECHPRERNAADPGVISLRGAIHRQCLDCHKDWSRANSCGFCHEEAGATMHGPEDFGELVGMTPTHISPEQSYTYHTAREGLPVVTFHHEDHVQAFGLSCADCHLNDDCERCHGAGMARQAVVRERDCASCHGDAECVDCHDLTEKARFDHAETTGWDLGAAHAEVSCEACHGPSHDAALTVPASLRCLACHQEAHGVTLDALEHPVALLGSHAYFECVQCHRGSAEGPRSTCIECHDDRAFPAWSPGLVGR
jgi:hypothetical protein